MRHPNFWVLLNNPQLPQQVEIIGEPDFLVRLFQEISEYSEILLSLHSVASVLDNPYQWSQTSLFDPAPQLSDRPIILYGKMGSREQKEILPRLPASRPCVLLSEKKSIPQWDHCYYRTPSWEQWVLWTEKLTRTTPEREHFCAISDQPWAMFDHWQQLRLLGEVGWAEQPGALSAESWKKFAQLRQSNNRSQLLQTQDWHQILYCCEMAHQRALAPSSDGFYGIHPYIQAALFQRAESRQAMSSALLGAYQEMVSAALANNTEDFLWGLSRWFHYEDLIVARAHRAHENAPN